jgi:flavin reductase (DIM6/NTAB) family NADH-FMN oxidoreductase RutF
MDQVIEQYRQALRRLAKAVVVITSFDGQSRYAMAATAVSELSFEPPSMLICVNRSASLYPVLAAKAPFAVNILSQGHVDLAALCSSAVKGEARFETAAWRMSSANVPILLGSQASISCSNVHQIDHGSHSIFLGNVMDVSLSDGIDPLVYMNGAYGRVELAREAGSRPPP